MLLKFGQQDKKRGRQGEEIHSFLSNVAETMRECIQGRRMPTGS